ncbi:MAG: PepSY domain-containing protein [Rhodospirillales bacterium]|nr:PepSY domain-containing protein [Rhodospirillales bacterium]
MAWRARGVRFHRSLHGAAGIWTVAILLVLAATGVVLAFPRTSRGLLGLEGGGPPRAMRIAGPAAVTTPDLDRALALARAAAPGAHLRAAFLPATPGEAIRVFLLAEGGEGAASAIAVQVAPDAGRVLAVQDARRQPPADRAYRWMHDLHEGAGLGPLWRAASVIGGLALPLFAVTGPLLWWLRRRNRRRLDHVRAAALQRGA